MDLLKNKMFWLTLLLAVLMTASFVLVSQISVYILVALILILIVFFFFGYEMTGIYLIAFLFPFNYLEFVYGSLNVPYVDLVALVLFFSWLIKRLYLLFVGKQKLTKNDFPALGLVLIFFIISALSLINVDRELFNYSLKYLFRPVIFFYLMYVILPFNIIDDLKKLYNTFKVMFITGIGVSLMGVWSLIFPPIEGLRRAIPVSIFGLYPLGSNHNLLAEVLVSVIPFALILFWYERNVLLKNIYLLGIFLMIGINLLTLSRGGWLALALELLILAIIKYRKNLKGFFSSYLFYIVLVLLTPVIYLMYKLMTSTVMASSSVARLKLIEVSVILFNEHPWFGSGVGTFTYILSQVRWYIIEYGEIVDAHGFLFKTMAEVGFLGALSFLGLLIYIIYVLAKGYGRSKKTQFNWLILGCLLAVVGIIAFEAFGTGYYQAKLWLPVGLAFTALKLSRLDFVKK